MSGSYVAPFTGAWIETTYLSIPLYIASASHPSRVRGLKLLVGESSIYKIKSHPSRVRGLKRFRRTWNLER